MNPPIVLVPLDGTERARVALPVAKRLAETIDGTLHLVHVSREPMPPEKVLVSVGLRGAAPSGSVVHTKEGDPPSGIVQAARERNASLIVMCTHTAIGAASKTIGRTALGVLKNAPCPVVLVRPERGDLPFSIRRILLPHDGTPTTSAAIRPAAELARSTEAELVVLHVAADGASAPAEAGSLTAPRYMDQPQHEWPAWAGEFVERLGCVCPLESLKVRMALAHGAPADELLRVASEWSADLVVLAWRGVWEGEHAATLKSVVRRTTCPLLVIRA